MNTFCSLLVCHLQLKNGFRDSDIKKAKQKFLLLLWEVDLFFEFSYIVGSINSKVISLLPKNAISLPRVAQSEGPNAPGGR